jgi:antitoxin Phd
MLIGETFVSYVYRSGADMTRLNVMEARKAFSKTVNRVAFGKERIVLERRGEDVAVLVSVEDAALLERLSEKIEDAKDVEEALRRLADPNDKPIPYDKVRKKLGLP